MRGRSGLPRQSPPGVDSLAEAVGADQNTGFVLGQFLDSASLHGNQSSRD